MIYFLAILISFVLSVGLTFLVKKIAKSFNMVDNPASAPERKIQKKPIPLLGGSAVYLSFALILLGFTFFSDHILGKNIELKNIIGILVAGLILIIGGVFDDKFDLSPGKQIAFPVLATLVIIAFGVGIDFVTNPFGGLIYLNKIKLQIATIGGVPYFINLFSDIFTFAWLMVIMYTIKFLDGLDGLVSGVSAIGGLVVAGLCLFTIFYQPEVALISLIFSGACLGFLVFNFHPAKIFLGESSIFCGMMLAVLAIISGGKIATALLVLAIPLLDLVWVIMRRIFIEKKSPWKGDRKHLHFRLLDLGLSHRKAVLVLYAISFIFGLVTLVGDSLVKLGVLIFLFIAMLGVMAWFANLDKERGMC